MKMAVTCDEVMALLDGIAPFKLAQDWDNAGLLIGRGDASVQNILVAMDLTPGVVEEAIQRSCEMIITHHPILFRGTNRITDADGEQKMILRLIEKGIALCACHTNFDSAQSGTSDMLIRLLGVTDPQPLIAHVEKAYKVVTFVPMEHAPAVRRAATAAGAGKQGFYEGCMFAAQGIGMFTPQEGAAPYIGQKGRFESVPEERMETFADIHTLPGVIKAVLQAHPYEEPVIDVYPLQREQKQGLGRVGMLKKPCTLDALCDRLSQYVKGQKSVVGEGSRMVSAIAVQCGAGGVSDMQIAKRLKADVLISADIKHHDRLYAAQIGMSLINCLHHESEYPGLLSLIAGLQEAANQVQYNVRVFESMVPQAVRYIE
jgi:dinuclear metal center YbgI/SA1388 family protein